jgi:hypothetical protein
MSAAFAQERIDMKTQRMTKVLALTAVLTLITGCEFADNTSHDCKAIAKAISQTDKSSLRSEYDKLMYESIIEQRLGSRTMRSYSLMHSHCVKLDKGRI